MAEALTIDTATEALKNLRQPPQEEQPIEEPQNFGEGIEESIDEAIVEPEPGEQPESEEVGADEGADNYELETDELAEILGIKGDQLNVNDEGKITLKAKIDGELSDVTLDSLINAYQGDANLTNRSKKIAESERAIQAKLSEYNQQSTEFANQAAKILEEVKTMFIQPYSKDELKTLREDDPAEYAARMEEVRQRERQFNSIVNEAVNLTNQSQQTITEDMKGQYVQYLEGERQKVRDAVPEWEKFEQDVVNYAAESGWTNEEIGMIADSRIQVALYKAMMFDKGKESVKKKLTKKIPKITKSGTTPPKGQVSLDQARKAQAKLKETGQMSDAIDLLKLRRK